MDQAAIAEAVKQICDEKGIPFESVIETINAALAAAYRKDFGEKNQNIEAKFNLETGTIEVFDVKTVVEDLPAEELAALEAQAAEEKPAKHAKEKPAEAPATEAPEGEEKRRFNPKTELQLSDAVKVKKGVAVGEEIRTQLELPGDFGRMAAQTAKQVITQKLRETERETLFAEYKQKEGEIIVGTVQRREGRAVLVDLGRITAVIPPDEQIEDESYVPGNHLKFYIVAVNSTTKGPEILLSRSHPAIVKKLFSLEIPEIANGTVEIKGVAREAGSRSKIAVWTGEENIDPIGSCIGQRGARIQTIISELKGEKVDIVKWNEDPKEFISNALSPARINRVELNEDNRVAKAFVDENQLSLAIGKGGQNVRLAAKLTGWKIDVVGSSEVPPTDAAPAATSETVETTQAAPATETAGATETAPATPGAATSENTAVIEEKGEKKEEEAAAAAETKAPKKAKAKTAKKSKKE